jgi:superfamily II DNA or RNA helicase
VLRLSTRLSEDERHAYEEAYAPFAEMRRALARAHPDADWNALVEALTRSAAGRAALRGFYRAVAIASMPQGKMRLVSQLLADHRSDKSLVFCATADQACAVARRDLVPAITAETRRSERERVLARFREGALRAIVSARVLNEGVDVPDANVAILAAGALGVRELVQRVGRVLRAAPGKRAVVYELTTAGTIDDRRAEARRRMLAADCPAFA